MDPVSLCVLARGSRGLNSATPEFFSQVDSLVQRRTHIIRIRANHVDTKAHIF